MKRSFYLALITLGISLSFAFSASVVSASSILPSTSLASSSVEIGFPNPQDAKGGVIITQPITGTLCESSTIVVNFTASGVLFDGANQFNVELSDATGSFDFPTVIGTLAFAGQVNSSTYIYSQIPSGIPAGLAYRIRVVSSSPAIIGSDNGANITIKSQVAPPIPSITVNGPSEFCYGSASTFLISSSGAGNLWFPGGVNTNPFLGVVSSGCYYTQTTGVNGCATSAIPVCINVNTPIFTFLAYFENGQLVTTADTTVTICEGDSAQIGIVIEGGVAPYDISYSLDELGSANTVTDVGVPFGVSSYVYTFYTLNPGFFQTISVADNFPTNCGATASTGTVTVRTAPRPITSFSYNPFCGATSKPAIPSTGFLGGGVYSFDPVPSDGATINPVNGVISAAVSGATYTVKYTVQGPNCEASSTSTVTVNTSDVVEFNYAPFCPGTPSLTPIGAPGFAFGGTFSFTSVPGGSTTIVASTGVIQNSQPSTTYFVAYTSPAGACQATGLDTVTTFDSPLVTGVTDSSECGQSIGSIDISVTGGVEPYTYIWSNGSTTQDISALAAGSYTVTVGDSRSCSSVTAFTVFNSNQPIITLADSAEATCGNNNGSLSVSVSNGVGPFGYSWSGGQTTSSISSLPAGIYTVTVRDSGTTCEVSRSFTIVNEGSPTVNFTTVNPTCGQDTGSINVTVTGGTGIISHHWSTGQITEDLSNLSAGTYVDTVRDENSCQVIFSVNLINSNQFFASETHENPTCANPSSGSITIAIVGGAAPFQFAWSPNTQNVSQTVSGLTSGTYQVVITDAAACSTTVSATLAPVNTLTLSTDSVGKATCGNADGFIDLKVAGGSGNYTYIWSNDSTTQDISGLAAGIYSVEVKDQADITCSAFLSVTILENLPILTFEKVNTSCTVNTGSIVLTITNGSGDYSFSWTGPNNFTASTQNIENLGVGSYEVTVTDSGTTCVTSQTQIITLVNPPVITTVNARNTTCAQNNGLIDITISSGTQPYTITWEQPGLSGQDQVNLAPGTYVINVVDSLGCGATQSFTIAPSVRPTSDLTFRNPSCGSDTGSINLTLIDAASPVTFLWRKNGESFAATEDISSLAPGFYTVRATDLNGCIVRDTATLDYPDRPVIDSTVIVPTQCGLSTGSIDLFVTAVNGIDSISWSGPNGFVSSNQNIENLAVGCYSVIVTGNLGCTVATQVCLQNENSPQVQFVNVQPSCNQSNGSVTAIITGGVPPYSITWNGSASTDTFRTGLAAGSYTINVTDVNTCITSFTTSLLNSGIPQLTADQTNSTCGDSTGSITLQVTSGLAPYTFVWSTGNETTRNLDSLAAGTYSVQVTDSAGCVVNGNFIIQNSNSFQLGFTTIEPPCNDNSGSITLTLNPVSINYVFDWAGTGVNATSQNQADLAAGIYTVVVQDTASSCADSLAITLGNSNDFNIIADSTVITNATCGLSNGAISIELSEGSGIFTFGWCNGTTSIPATTGLAAGTCNLTITDSETGCIVTDTFAVGNTPGAILNATVTDATCDSCNGRISLSISGGTTPYTVLWSNGASDTLLVNLCGADYSVTVTDSLGCNSSLGPITVAPGNPPVAQFTKTDTQCGDSTGTVTISVTNGVVPFTFSWTGPDGFADTAQNIDSLEAGVYNLVVTDSVGCTDNISVEIEIEGQPDVSFEVDSTSCGLSNGQITVTLTPAPSETPTFAWTGPDGFTSASQNISALAAGTYVLSITIGNCTTVDSTVIVNQDGPSATISLSEDTVCAGQFSIITIGLTGTAPFTFKYSDGNSETTVTSFGGTTFTLSVNPASSTTYTITSLVSDSDPACQGSISPGPATLQVNPVPVAPEVTPAGPLTFCPGESAVLTSDLQTGNTWSTGELTQSITVTTSGSYFAYSSNSFGCADTSNVVSVTVPENPAPFAGNDTTICRGASVQLNATGATDYIWSPSIYLTGTIIPNPVATPLETTTYTVTGSGDCGSGIDTITITVNQPVDPSLGEDRTVCPNDTLTLSVASLVGASYSWNPASAINGSTTGSSVEVTTSASTAITLTTVSSQGCSASDTIQINILTPPPAPVVSSNGPTTFCEGDSVILSVPNGNFISWSNGLQNFDEILVTESGTYTATYTGGNCAVTSASIVVVVNVLPEATIISNGSTTICEETCVTLNAVQNAGIQWTLPGGGSSASGSVSACSTGVYILNVTADGCTGSDSVSVTVVPKPPVPTISVDGNLTICPNETVVLSSSSVSGNQWLINGIEIFGETGNTLTVTIPGNYSLTSSSVNANNCSSTSSVVVVSVKPPSPMSIFTTNSDTILCGGQNETITLYASSGFVSYTWTGVSSTEDSVIVSAPGVYSVTGVNSFGCSTTDEITITEAPGFTLSLSSPVYFDDFNITVKGESDGSIDLTVNDGQSPFTYIWSPGGQTTEDRAGIPAGLYTVTVTDAFGCEVKDSIKLKEPDDIKLPNGFTPNGDGFNDFYVIKGIQGFPENQVNIFNRWGSLVYSKNVYTNDWNGVSNDGNVLPDGTYFIVVDLNKEGKDNVEGSIDLRRAN